MDFPKRDLSLCAINMSVENIFAADQRWTSETEPELGLGTVVDTGNGRVTVLFDAPGETRMYAAANAPLRRARFKVGDTIKNRQGASLVVENVREDNALFIYSGQGREIPEIELGNMLVSHGADERLMSGNLDSPSLFNLRYRTLVNDHRRRRSSVRGFVGGRIDLIPHQLYIAHEVSSRQAPRVLLSDEVGLGKTIEACLILHRLLLSGRVKRILILVPESLVHQWFVEMLRRFNVWLHIFDEERCAAIEDGAPDGNPFLDDQLVICSTVFLTGSRKRAAQALSASWDILVVDEAHHLQWTPELASPEYALVELLSRQAEGLLLLTATPEQLGQESHFARLRLLDPDRYSDYQIFLNEPKDYTAIADRIAEVSKKTGLDEVARRRMIDELLDLHGPGRVIFRNTRASMSGFPERRVHLAAIADPTDHKKWVERVTSEFESDVGKSAPRSRFQYGDDPRLRWLVSKLQELAPQKVLLICRSKEKVTALDRVLRDLINIKSGVFHEDLTLVQRDRNAAWFAEEDGARLLMCSEIGSEGRNFQFAHHLVLFDLPLHPELLEQRIGRLDRIGQTGEINIHVPFLTGSPQNVLARWYHEGLNAFENNLEGGNQISRLFGQRVCDFALQYTGSEITLRHKKLKTLLDETRNYRDHLVATLARGRDRLLEMNSFRPLIANKLIDAIQSEDQDATLETYMLDVFEEFAIEIEDLAPRTYALHARDVTRDVFPSIPQDGVTVTFDRKRALSREDISFLSWDHPMVTGAVDLILGSEAGNASFGVIPGSDESSLLLEAVYIVETVAEGQQHVDRFLPSTPVRVVVDHAQKDVTGLYPASNLAKQVRRGHVEHLFENSAITQSILPAMLETASDLADRLASSVVADSLRDMNTTTSHEIERLKKLRKINTHIRPEEIRLAELEQARLAAAIENARVRLDSVRLIQVGNF